MVQLSYTVLLALAASVLAVPSPLTPDPAGAKNVGNGVGTQFIGGACLSAADCASTCCATLAGAGICSGPGAQFQAGKQGCGFGGAGGAGAAAPPKPSSPATPPPANGAIAGAAGSQNVGLANGSQFITGQCLSDADCASTCCSKATGLCAARLVATAAGGPGCGFGN